MGRPELIAVSSDDEDDALAPSLSISESKPPTADDDCCILDYDPQKNVRVPDFQASDADDLVLVGERGPVACRDFPHARHLCVKFPFTTTSHEKYCEQCYCYVCDVIAPCLLWGQGKQSSDHCHAFDKDKKWKKMRSHGRSVVIRLAAHSPEIPLHQGQRTGTQPTLRVPSTTRAKSSTSRSSISANVSSVNQNFSSLPEDRPTYCPSKIFSRSEILSMMQFKRNMASVGGMNIPRIRNSNIDTNNRRRPFTERNSSHSKNAPSKTTL